MWNAIVILQSKIVADFKLLSNRLVSAVATSNKTITAAKTRQVMAVLAVQSNKLSNIIATSNKTSSISNVTTLVATILQGVFVKLCEILDTASITDTATASVGKGIPDSAILVDTASMGYASNITVNPTSITDTFNRVVAFDRTFSDPTAVVDTAFTDYNSNPSSPTALTDIALTDYSNNPSSPTAVVDTFDRIVVFNPSILDSINATDDIDGAASMEDDQTAQFFKYLTDPTTSITDTFDRVVAFDRTFSDPTAVVDTTLTDYNNNPSSPTALVDTFDRVVAFDRTFSDPTAVSDITNTDYSNNLTSNPTAITDTSSTSYSNNITNITALTDTFDASIGFGRVFSDITAITDVGRIFLLTYANADYFSEEYVGDVSTF